MAYRNPDEALKARAAELGERADALVAARAEVRAAIARADGERARAQALVAEGATGRGPRREDRVDVAAWGLVAVALLLIPLHIDWHRYVARDPTVVAAIAWLGAPAVLALMVAWPYRGVSVACRGAFLVALVACLVPLVNLLTGWL
jgi:hypothetical protein